MARPVFEIRNTLESSEAGGLKAVTEAEAEGMNG